MSCNAEAPTVSVIMNVRNGAASLRAALDSVLAQTFTDWELIVWDDCSTDESARIVAEYSMERIRYFLSPADVTLGRARDIAMQHARGEWLAFLDQDDIWLPDKLQKQLALAAGDPSVGLIYGRTVMFSAGSRDRDFDHRHEFELPPEGDIFLRLFIDSCFISMSSAVLRRSAVAAIGGIPDFIHVIPDYYLFVAIARHYRARAVQEVVCRYRRHAGSMSHFSGIRMHAEALMVVDLWAPALPAELAERRRTVHSTVQAFEELCRLRTARTGIVRLLSHGSPAFLLSRPFARTFRAVRRQLRRPYWLSTGDRPAVQRQLGGGVERMVSERDSPAITLSVIVVNWNVRELLRECLRSLQEEMRLPADAWELIVVDNASRDDTVEMLRRDFPDTTVLANSENVGFARANNQAYSMCRGTFILLLNPDTIVLDHGIDRMLELMQQRPDVAAMGCRMVGADGSLQRWTGGYPPTTSNVVCHFLLTYKLLPSFLLPRPLYLEHDTMHDIEVGWVSGACMLLRRRALTDTMFDERFFLYGEDMDLCERLVRAGWKVVYTPRAQIVHYDGRSLEQQTSEMQLNKLRTMREIFRMRNRRHSIVVYDLAVTVGFFLRSIAFGAASIVRPHGGYAPRAAKSRRMLAEAFRSLTARRA